MPQAVRRVQELRNWNRLNNGSRLLEENEICPHVSENLHSTLTAHYKEKVSETQQTQGTQLEKAINSDSSPRLIFQSISVFAQTLAISLCAAARGWDKQLCCCRIGDICLSVCAGSQGLSTSLEENRNFLQTLIRNNNNTNNTQLRFWPQAHRCALLLWKGGSLQLNTARAIPKERNPPVPNTPSGAAGSKSPRKVLPSAMKCSGT